MSSSQWRRQTIKSCNAFKGHLYFQVGQMEGPKVDPEQGVGGMKRRSTEGIESGEGSRSSSPINRGAICPQKKSL